MRAVLLVSLFINTAHPRLFVVKLLVLIGAQKPEYINMSTLHTFKIYTAATDTSSQHSDPQSQAQHLRHQHSAFNVYGMIPELNSYERGKMMMMENMAHTSQEPAPNAVRDVTVTRL